MNKKLMKRLNLTEKDLHRPDRISLLEESMLLADETAIEMYETLENQIAINLAQDESLIEIYELMEG